MPDISMCKNEKCKRKNKCYRYMAKPSMYQSYGDFDEKNCVYFWEVEDDREGK